MGLCVSYFYWLRFVKRSHFFLLRKIPNRFFFSIGSYASYFLLDIFGLFECELEIGKKKKRYHIICVQLSHL